MRRLFIMRKDLNMSPGKLAAQVAHCAPQDIASYISHGYYKPDILTMYLGEIARELKFTKWHFGHYHDDQAIMGKFILHYYNIERIL